VGFVCLENGVAAQHPASARFVVDDDRGAGLEQLRDACRSRSVAERDRAKDAVEGLKPVQDKSSDPLAVMMPGRGPFDELEQLGARLETVPLAVQPHLDQPFDQPLPMARRHGPRERR